MNTIYGKTFSFDINSYFNDLRMLNSENAFRMLVFDGSEYLNANQGIGEFITWFADEIDEGRGYSYHAELTAGLMFMLAERSMGQMYVREDEADLFRQIVSD